MENKVRDTHLREQLLDRRKMLQTAISKSETTESIVHLLREVDTALEKMAKSTYGLCETCHEPIENDRLVADPLIRNCIEDLTPQERRTLEHDLDLAYQIQSELLPKQNLKVGEWDTAYHYEAHISMQYSEAW